MSKKWKRQAMGVVLSAAMAVTALPVTALPVMAKEPEELLHFTFDNLTNGFQSNGYKAKIVGNKYDINDDSSYGKVLNLGGKTYLNVADENGKSPLTGLDELTVNYYSKPAAGGHNGWTFFATRDDETPHYLSSEHYIGIMDKADSVKAERHLVDNSSRPAALETKTESGWKMVTVVYEADKSTLYINGEKVSEEKSDAKLTDILQDNSTLKIGKSNWGEEYFAGELDDYSIYAGALSKEEIAELYENKSNETVLSTNEKIHKVADSLEIPNADCIKGNITLPTENEYGAKITWKSSDPDVINDKDDEAENYGKIPAGVVHRGKEDKKVTLTATISLDGEEETKQFEVNVVKKADKKQLDKYLFTFFPSNDDENLYFSAGSDHLHFKDLNDGKPVLTSSIGDEGIRDPFIFRSAEGDHFYIIATDLKVNETGWGNAQYNGSLKMLVWESDDLVNWSEPRLVDVGLTDKDFENYGKVSCLWAPEAIYDEKTGEYVVFWASMTTEDGVSHQITYYSKTRDFVNFTTAEKYIDRGDKQHCIDTSIVEANGKYYRVSADTNANGGLKSEIIIETSDSVLGEWTRLCNMDDLSGGMQNYDKYYAEEKVPFVGGKVEGPEFFTLNDGKTWGLYVDNYGGIGYIPTTTTDISDTTGKSWTAYTSDQFDFGSLKKRHGSIIGITEDEYEAIMDKWYVEHDTPSCDEEESETPVLSYEFDEASNGTIADVSGNHDASLKGNATVTEGSEKGKVLKLDGNKSYLEIPQGFFDGRDVCTISFDMKPSTVDGNFFNFTVGLDNSKYFYLRSRENSTYMAITTNSWQNEQGLSVNTDSVKNTWTHYDVVFDKDKMSLYINGILKGSRNISISFSDLGSDLISYLGKSFYDADSYVNGSYDNFKVYNRALSEAEIAKNSNIELPLLKSVTAEDITFITQKIDDEAKEATLYYSINNTSGDVTDAKLNFELLTGAKVIDNSAESFDLTKPFTIKIANSEKEETYTIKSISCNNPALGGEYADPDIDCFDGKYYIYPTTDGYSGWSGYQFKVFSSDDLVNWKDEGVILDLKQDSDADTKNKNGVKIASVPWSDGSAWAPTIEERNGKYYFYFCGNDTATNAKAIGVAYADSPTGPFTVKDEALISIKTCQNAGINMGQAIDPSVFKDDDGTYWLSFGNGNAAIVKLNDDMTSIDTSTMKNVSGLNDFRESLIITKRDGVYHYTWSCDDTGSENYHINYGTSDTLGGDVTYRGTILSKDANNDILGTGHHSILNVPGTDDWYIAYARFMTPLGQISSGYGYHREVCIDKFNFDENGFMKKVTPTNIGITEPVYVKGYEPQPSTPSENVTPGEDVTPSENVAPDEDVTPSENKSPNANVNPSEEITPSENKTPSEVPSPSENTVSNDNTPTAPADNIITGDNAALSFGNKYTLKTGFKVKKFVVSDKKVLSVTKKGKIKVKHAGTVTITAIGKNNEEKVFSNIIVEKPTLKALTVNSTESIDISKMLDGIKYTSPTAYRSSNTNVAEIDSEGKITIKSKGKTTITVQFGAKKYKKALKVKI